MELVTESGWHIGIPLVVSRLLRTLVERGQVDEADQLLRQLGLDGPIPDTAIFFGNVLLARGQLRLVQQRLEEGLDDLLEIGRREAQGGYHEETWAWVALAAPALVATGKRVQAVALVEHELERARRRGVVLNEAIALRALGLVSDADNALIAFQLDNRSQRIRRMKPVRTAQRRVSDGDGVNS